MAFPLLRSSDVSQFPSAFLQAQRSMLLFIARPYYFCDRDGYYDHIRKSHVLWEDISNLGASNIANEFCE